MIGRPGGGKTQAALRLVHSAQHLGADKLAFYFDLGLKSTSESLAGYVDRTLDGVLSVEARHRFDFFAFLVRAGCVICAFDGIDEGSVGNNRAAFLSLFSELAELLSASSNVVFVSRESFLMESPYMRQLLDRDALVSETLARELTGQRDDPLALPSFEVLRLGEPAHGDRRTPLERHMRSSWETRATVVTALSAAGLQR